MSNKTEKSGFDMSLEGPQDWPPKMFKVHTEFVDENRDEARKVEINPSAATEVKE